MGGRFRHVARTWVVVLGVALGVSLALPASPAAAHNSLTGSNPKDGARVADAPTRVELRFLSKPDPGTTKITITGPDNVAAAGGEATFSGSRVSVPFAPGAAGLYIVGYQVASADGHPITGEVRFTLTTGTPAQPPSSAAAPSEAAPSSGAATPSGGTSTGALSSAGPGTAAPAAVETSDDGPPGWLWMLGGGVLLLAAAATVLVTRRRTTRT
ncbi:copper resistance protein CopC [Micromonospora sp. RTGN7]|uniref:copper resistance CopC family protein n=1 Tax=Micromonospora sp. RTGN7 TaxID=3016526 RepID=UPI0029FEDEA1|nr:copper resistance protein CopC [Micromonospora sp. RTGN7]